MPPPSPSPSLRQAYLSSLHASFSVTPVSSYWWVNEQVCIVGVFWLGKGHSKNFPKPYLGGSPAEKKIYVKIQVEYIRRIWYAYISVVYVAYVQFHVKTKDQKSRIGWTKDKSCSHSFFGKFNIIMTVCRLIFILKWWNNFSLFAKYLGI